MEMRKRGEGGGEEKEVKRCRERGKKEEEINRRKRGEGGGEEKEMRRRKQ